MVFQAGSHLELVDVIFEVVDIIVSIISAIADVSVAIFSCSQPQEDH